ncbi:DUF397 domain-containing protein [Streptomyces antioxidans]|nr:DUF397 domain-containing protein [Streptomyces antioxidans]
MTWRKPSFSGPGETKDCVELAAGRARRR